MILSKFIIVDKGCVFSILEGVMNIFYKFASLITARKIFSVLIVSVIIFRDKYKEIEKL